MFYKAFLNVTAFLYICIHFYTFAYISTSRKSCKGRHKPFWQTPAETYNFISTKSNESYHVLNILLGRMTFNWLRISRKATSKEIDWFISIVGKHEMKSFFSSLDEERKLSFENAIELNKKWLGDSPERKILLDIKKNDKEQVKKCDLSIKPMIEELQKKYTDVEKEHPVFYELIMEMIYPSFIH